MIMGVGLVMMIVLMYIVGVIIQTLLPINIIIDINNIPYPIYKPKKTRD